MKWITWTKTDEYALDFHKLTWTEAVNHRNDLYGSCWWLVVLCTRTGAFERLPEQVSKYGSLCSWPTNRPTTHNICISTGVLTDSVTFGKKPWNQNSSNWTAKVPPVFRISVRKSHGSHLQQTAEIIQSIRELHGAEITPNTAQLHPQPQPSSRPHSITAVADVNPHLMNTHQIPEYRSRCSIFHCHENGYRQKLLTFLFAGGGTPK